MKILLYLENWNRKEHFLYFNQLEEPFFGISATIDCTKGYETAKKNWELPFLYIICTKPLLL